jgi:peptidoglycan/xylan/chitin deacetylase (PgdA/CDA1 family)
VYLLFHDVYLSDPRESGFRSRAADRYKLSSAQFDCALAALAGITRPALPFALTFDDGGISFYSVIADRLEALGWRGHCLVPTDTIDRPGFLTRSHIRELDRRGHQIGSHSASHPARMSACSKDEIVHEWTHSREVLEDIVGHRVMTASVPGGYLSRAVAEAAAVADIHTLFTSEPVTHSHHVAHCRIVGRFALRHSSAPQLSAQLVQNSPWSRWAAWADWNIKGLIKPILGSSYVRVADRLLAPKATKPSLLRTQEKRP